MTPTTTHRVGRRIVAATIALATVAAACGSDDDGASEDTASDGDDAAAQPAEDITLQMFDNETGAVSDIWDELIEEFEAENPGVTVERSSRSFEDYLASARLVATGPDAPDIIQGNLGYSLDGPLVEAGALLSLDPYVEQYGWADTFSDGALRPLRFSEDGSTWGDGPLWGMSPLTEIVGVYVNTALAAQLGVDPIPESFEDFENSLAAAAADDVTGIIVGNLDRWPGTHFFNVIQNALAPAEENTDWVLGVPGSTIETDGNTTAAETLQAWVDAGYVNDDANGVGYDDSWARFADGGSLYYFTGSWLSSTLVEQMGDDVAFFVMPSADAGPVVATGGFSSPLHVSSQTDHPDVAVALLDHLTGPRTAERLAEAQLLPSFPTETGFAAGSIGEQLATEWARIQDGGSSVPYLDFATSSMPDTIFAATQELIGGNTDPGGYLGTLQGDWAEFYDT